MDSDDAAQGFIDEFGGVDFPSVVDPEGDKAVEWGVFGVPETFLVDRDGRIVRKTVGTLTDEWVATYVVPCSTNDDDSDPRRTHRSPALGTRAHLAPSRPAGGPAHRAGHRGRRAAAGSNGTPRPQPRSPGRTDRRIVAVPDVPGPVGRRLALPARAGHARHHHRPARQRSLTHRDPRLVRRPLRPVDPARATTDRTRRPHLATARRGRRTGCRGRMAPHPGIGAHGPDGRWPRHAPTRPGVGGPVGGLRPRPRRRPSDQRRDPRQQRRAHRHRRPTPRQPSTTPRRRCDRSGRRPSTSPTIRRRGWHWRPRWISEATWRRRCAPTNAHSIWRAAT